MHTAHQREWIHVNSIVFAWIGSRCSSFSLIFIHFSLFSCFFFCVATITYTSNVYFIKFLALSQKYVWFIHTIFPAQGSSIRCKRCVMYVCLCILATVTITTTHIYTSSSSPSLSSSSIKSNLEVRGRRRGLMSRLCFTRVCWSRTRTCVCKHVLAADALGVRTSSVFSVSTPLSSALVCTVIEFHSESIYREHRYRRRLPPLPYVPTIFSSCVMTMWHCQETDSLSNKKF